MKINNKIMIGVLGLVLMNNLFAATASPVPVDPDATVYSALSTLCGDASISALNATDAAA